MKDKFEIFIKTQIKFAPGVAIDKDKLWDYVESGLRQRLKIKRE